MARIGASASFESKELINGGGNQEKAIPKHSRQARRLRIGVRKPIRRQAPLNNRIAEITERRNVIRSEESRQRLP